MDYKYIEQLLERYWQCETSLEEESILQTFFAQKEVPTEFLKYKGLFSLPMEEKQENFLGADFDKKVLAAIEEEGSHVKVKVIRVSLRESLMPLFKSAAVVAIILSLGGAAQFQFGKNGSTDEINYADYKDTYKDPAMAYDQVEDALELISEGFCQSAEGDSSVSIHKAATTDIKTAE